MYGNSQKSPIQQFIERNGFLNINDKVNGQTILQKLMQLYSQNPDAISQVIQAVLDMPEFDYSIMDTEGQPALFQLLELCARKPDQRDENIAMIRKAINRNPAALSALDNNQRSFISIAAQYNLGYLIEVAIEIEPKLKDSLTDQDNQGLNPAHYAAAMGHLEAFNILCRINHALVLASTNNAGENVGFNPACFAILNYHQRPGEIEAFLTGLKNADYPFYEESSNGVTPLGAAATQTNNSKVMNFLLNELKLDVNHTNNLSAHSAFTLICTALKIIDESQKPVLKKMLDTILTHEQFNTDKIFMHGLNVMHWLINTNDSDTLEKVYQTNNKAPHQKDFFGKTVLYHVAIDPYYNMSTTRTMVEKFGVDINEVMTLKDYDQVTGTYNPVRLITSTAETTVLNCTAFTRACENLPDHFADAAKRKCQIDKIEYLAHRPDFKWEFIDSRGINSLSWALETHHKDFIAEIAKAHEEMLSQKDLDGRTPWDWVSSDESYSDLRDMQDVLDPVKVLGADFEKLAA